MLKKIHLRPRGEVTTSICFVVAVAVWVLSAGGPKRPEWNAASQAALRGPMGLPQLVSVEALPEQGQVCEWVPARASGTILASLQQEELAGGATAISSEDAGARTTVDADREPLRVIRDSYPTYSAIAVDTNSDEVYLQDENLFGLKVFDRLDDTSPTAAFTEPKRMVGGIQTKLEFNCGLYVDPNSGDVYSVNNDTVDTLVIFGRDAQGNVPPKRELSTPHGTYGIAVDEEGQEMFLTVQHESAVVVFRKMAEGEEPPLRRLRGEKTRLADPHGIALDPRNDLMFVSNHGNTSSLMTNDRRAPGSGRFEPPSITVHSVQASGDTAPLRIIQGPRTQLNWPAAMSLDPERGELYVANDAGDSILVFRTTDSGDVAPARIIRGPQTGIKNPTGVFLDLKNDELWVSNMGNHSATVYPRSGNGDIPPLRTIRSAPLGKVALAIGNPGAAAYDSKRDEILVPN